MTALRRPRLGDGVELRAGRFRVAALVLAPQRGYQLRPAGATDARRDRFLPLAEWAAAYAWDPAARCWTVSAA